MKLHPRLNFHLFCGFLFVLVPLLSGCSAPTEADRDNRRLLDAILTAITMKNTQWLEDDAKLADERHRAGHLTDWEFTRISEVIAKARTGDWIGSEKLGYEFRKEHPFVKEGH